MNFSIGWVNSKQNVIEDELCYPACLMGNMSVTIYRYKSINPTEFREKIGYGPGFSVGTLTNDIRGRGDNSTNLHMILVTFFVVWLQGQTPFLFVMFRTKVRLDGPNFGFEYSQDLGSLKNFRNFIPANRAP